MLTADNFSGLTEQQVSAAYFAPHPLPPESQVLKIKMEIARLISAYLDQHQAFTKRGWFPSDSFDHTAPASPIEVFACRIASDCVRERATQAIFRSNGDL